MLKRLFHLGRDITDREYSSFKLGHISRLRGIEAVPERVFYFPVPKTACTSIKTEIYRLQKQKNYVNGSHRTAHIHAFWDKRKVLADKYSERVIIVRDPIKRFLSAFGNRVKHHGELGKKAIEKSCPELLDLVPYFNPTLKQFVEHLDIYLQVPSIKHHCMPLRELLCVDLAFFTKVISIEHIDQFRQLLEVEYSQPVQFPREQTAGKKIPVHRLSRKHLEKLFSFYSEDYRMLEGVYSRESLLAEWLDGKQRVESHNRNKNKKSPSASEKGA